MMFATGLAVGALISFVVLVAFMAPKHWDWYHEIVTLKAVLRNTAEERDHYKNLVGPRVWGEQESKTVKPKPYAETATAGNVEYGFDDIKDGD